MRKKFTDKPKNMQEIKLPIKAEGRSRAKILTDEAFRETRNYIDLTNDNNPNGKDFLHNLYKKMAIKTKDKDKERNVGEIFAKTSELREILNKISFDNYDVYLNQILKYEYNEELLENFKNLIYAKSVTEKLFYKLYINICYEMFKLFNKKTYPNRPEMNFKNILLKKTQDEFYSPNTTKVAFPFHMVIKYNIRMMMNE